MASKQKKQAEASQLVATLPEQDTPLPLRRIGRINRGIIVKVPCPLYPATEESPALVVGFRVDNSWRVANEAGKAQTEDDARRYVAAIAPEWEGWDFLDEITGEPIPAPTATDPDTYKVLDTMPDIAQWVPVGYKAALEQYLSERLGPNGERVSPPLSTN